MNNMTSRSYGDASPGATEHNDAWTARQGKLKLDPEIKLLTLDSVATDFQHSRVPDLSASIRVLFRSGEKTPVCI